MTRQSKDNFQKQIELGKLGEIKVMERLARCPFLTLEADVREVIEYQKQDIDFLVTENGLFEDKGGVGLEVKSDFTHYSSGNMFFQLFNNVETNRLGDVLRTKAKYLAYVFYNEDKVYIMESKELKVWLLEESDGFRKRKTNGSNSLGVIIPSKQFFKEYPGKIQILN